MTNGDRIRSMDDLDLALFLDKFKVCDICAQKSECSELNEMGLAVDCSSGITLLDWTSKECGADEQFNNWIR